MSRESVSIERHIGSDSVQKQPCDGVNSDTSKLVEMTTTLLRPEQLLSRIKAWKLRSRPQLEEPYVAPRHELEEALVAIWCDALCLDQVGINDNFFKLGGNSLQMTQIAARIRAEFSDEIHFADFFASPTVAGLARFLTRQAVAEFSEYESSSITTRAPSISNEEECASISREDPVAQWRPDSRDHVTDALQISDPTLERFRCGDISRLNAGEGWELVYLRGQRAMHLLDASSVRLLTACKRFRTLDEHAAAAGPGGAAAEARARLAELRQAGLLNSYEEVMRTFLGEASLDDSVPITTVGFTTCDRVGALARCLTSYIKNREHYRRENEILVVDDSRGSESRVACKEMLSQFGRERGVSILYAGLDEKLRFVEELSKHGLPREITNAVLFDVEQCGLGTYGANRNAFLLETAGAAILSVDDDVEIRAVCPPDQRGGVALASERRLQGEPTEIWVFQDRENLLREVRFGDSDFVAAHEAMLGRSVRACLSTAHRGSGVNLDGVDQELLRKAAMPDARVRVTLNGVAGDCGWGSPSNYLFLRGESFRRLTQSETAYQQTTASREIVRVAAEFTVTDTAKAMMSTCFGLDNRDILPPFMPVGRGSDYVFAMILSKCANNACFAHLPSAILHTPVESRRFWPGEVLRSASGIDIAEMMSLLIRSFQAQPAATPGERMRQLGEYLEEIGQLPAEEFEVHLRYELAQQTALVIAELERRLQQYESDRPYWAKDVRAYAAGLRENVVGEYSVIPLDLLYGRTPEEARWLARRLVVNFAHILRWWPELVSVAKKLRKEGRPLARSVVG